MTITLHRPPTIPFDVIQSHLKAHYGVEGALTLVTAERDQNIHIETLAGPLLLKISGAEEGAASVEAQALALQHIADVDVGLPVPRVVPPLSDGPISLIVHDGVKYPALLLTWLEGELLASAHVPYRNWRSLGGLVARLGKAMRGFVHPAVSQRSLVWDVMRADELLPHICILGEAWQDKAKPLLTGFRVALKPQLKHLRTQIIHGDIHPHNLVVVNDTVTGIIDFGDMVHGPLVLDIVATIADCLHEEQDITGVFSDLVRGYHDVTPLEDAEVELVVDLVKIRLLAGAIISRLQAGEGQEATEAIASYALPSLQTLENVMTHEEALRTVCRSAAGLPVAINDDVLARRTAAMGPKPLLFYSKPLHMLRGQGVWLHADDGRRYLDCYNNVAHVGHAHPRVADAVARQLRILNTNTRYLTDQSIAYAEALKATLHPSLDTVIFVNSGSEANDVAWRMANVFTGNTGALCTDFAYHGVTMAADALSPSNYPLGKWRFPHVRQLEAPDLYRGPVTGEQENPGAACAALADGPIAELRAAGHGVSIAIMDSAFMTNGILDAPAGYVSGVMQRVHAAGGLFIADEVQSGFGRMGSHMWDHQRHGVVPDFVTIGKPAGNGYPIGAIITRADILQRFVAETGPFFSTFGGGNAACAAGLAVLDVMHDEKLMAAAETTGNAFRQNLRKLMQDHEIIGDVRGSGLAVGVELVRSRQTKEPAFAETKRVLDLMREQGVLIGSDGKHGNVLKLRPPLVFNSENADQVVATLDKVLQQL